jgi:predicted  nucleic acid-binding Zn-ribbon protein
MAVAKIYPEPTAYKRGGVANSFPGKELKEAEISKARTVLRFASDLVGNVLSGARSLKDAYQEAKRRKDAASSTESRIAELRGRYPDLADKVVEDELTIEGAFAEANARDQRLHEKREGIYHGISNALRTRFPRLPGNFFQIVPSV